MQKPGSPRVIGEAPSVISSNTRLGELPVDYKNLANLASVASNVRGPSFVSLCQNFDGEFCSFVSK